MTLKKLILLLMTLFLFSCASGPTVFSAKGNLDVQYTACENNIRTLSFTIIAETDLYSPYLVLNGTEDGKEFKKVLNFSSSINAGESLTIKETFLCNIENMTAYGWEEATSGYSPLIYGIEDVSISIK